MPVSSFVILRGVTWTVSTRLTKGRFGSLLRTRILLVIRPFFFFVETVARIFPSSPGWIVLELSTAAVQPQVGLTS